MAYPRHAFGAQQYDYPVELVWRALTGGSSTPLVDPLDEETFNNTQPQRGTVYTRALESRTNEFLSFQIKTVFYLSSWQITLKSLAPCKTRVDLEMTMDFNDFKSLAMCSFGFGLGAEARRFLDDLEHKLLNEERKRKLK